jgi:hypothetical protein
MNANHRRDQREIASETAARDNRVAAAIRTLTNAGLKVEPIDDQTSLVAERFEWNRLTNFWKERASGTTGTGLADLIKAAREPAP